MAVQLAGVLTPLIVLPAVVHAVGTQGWVGFSIGYSVGVTGAVATAFAWPMLGPARVAGITTREAAAVYRTSESTRLLAFLLAGASAGCIAFVLAPNGNRTLSALTAVALSSWGLTPSWYFVGRGTPRGIVIYETLPRFASTLVSVPLITWSGSGIWYSITLLTGSMISFVVMRVSMSHHLDSAPKNEVAILEHLSLTLATLVGTGYTSLLLPVAQLAHPPIAQMANLAGATRIRSMSSMGTSAVTSALQGWVAEVPDPTVIRRRQVRAILITCMTGVATSMAVLLAATTAARYIFAGASHLDGALLLLTALTCIPFAVSSSLSFHVLAPAGRVNAISISRIVATVLSLPMAVVAVRIYGAAGALGVGAAGELVVALWQGGAALPLLRRSPLA